MEAARLGPQLAGYVIRRLGSVWPATQSGSRSVYYVPLTSSSFGIGVPMSNDWRIGARRDLRIPLQHIATKAMKPLIQTF